MPHALVSHTVCVNSINFHVVAAGPLDAPPLLCMPGALGTAETDFEPQLRGLSEDFRVVSFDPRGYGRSRPPVRDFPLDFYVRDALDGAAIMHFLGHHRYAVLGWSDGGNSAVHVAAQFPDRVAALVIWGSNSYITKEDIDLWEQTRDVSRTWSERKRAEMAAVYGMDELQTLWTRFCDGMLALLNLGEGDVCKSALKGVRCPAFILAGGKDPMVAPEHRDYFHQHLRKSHLHVFPQGRHNIHIKYAAEFNVLVGNFLKKYHRRVDTRESNLDGIAYGYMAAQALFAALELQIFDHIQAAPGSAMSLGQVQAAVSTHKPALQTLLTALTACSLLHKDPLTGAYTNAENVSTFLVRRSKHFYGDYLRLQIAKQFYPMMTNLPQAITGRTMPGVKVADYTEFLASPAEAETYTRAQHNGSAATAKALARRIDLRRCCKALDLGGGSGAFSVELCRAAPQLEAHVLDLPEVVKVSAAICREESPDIAPRIKFIGGSALDRWPTEVREGAYDVVLMSYITGSLPTESLSFVYKSAFEALRPGGELVVHDFMVDDSKEGPQLAALWALQHVCVNPDGSSLHPAFVSELCTGAGFPEPSTKEMIAGMTKLMRTTKPACKL